MILSAAEISEQNNMVKVYYIDMERYSGLAGIWYPDDREELDGYVRPDLFGYSSIMDAVLPHAGLYYSSDIIRQYFEKMDENTCRIVIISPSHYFRIPPDRLCIAPFSSSQTPYGNIETIPLAIRDGILSAEALQKEHGVEMFLPFIKAADISVSYALINEVSDVDSINRLAEELIEITDRNTGFIASSDFTHYGKRFGYMPYGNNAENKVKENDSECARLLSRMETEEVLRRFTGGTICGIAPAMIVSRIAYLKGRTGSTGLFYTSDDITGEKSDDFVSYQSVLWRR